MKILNSMLTLTWLLMMVTSCSKSDGGETLVLPSNLQIETTIATDGSGLVTVKASAQNSNFYVIYFGETADETPVTAGNGQASHSYGASGAYTIKVQAHTTTQAFISASKDIQVTVGGSTGGDGSIPTTGYTTPTSYPNMTLVWQDEFTGTALNESDWTFETGGGGWGNNELQYYQKANTSVGGGYLTITAKKESVGGNSYTSSRIITKDKKVFKFGRIDIRALLPKGQGIWPALWLLGNNISTVGWPKCGEIDIMELVGGNVGDKTVYGTAHWWDTDAVGHASYGGNYTLGSGIFADAFHVFTITWNANAITWYVDDVQYHTIDISPERLDELRNASFVIFNVAVGGNWPKNPDSTTVFPQKMVVDYIRVFQ